MKISYNKILEQFLDLSIYSIHEFAYELYICIFYGTFDLQDPFGSFYIFYRISFKKFECL